MPDPSALLARIGGGLFQRAWVVADLEAAEHALRSALALGFARSGNVQIELIQPVRGDGIHFEFLA